MNKSLLFVLLLCNGCAHRIVQGNPLTLPTLEKGRAITHLSDEREANAIGDVTISEKGWVLVIFDHPFSKPAACNIRASKKLQLKMSEPDGIVLAGRPGDRIHFACLGQKPEKENK